MRTHKIVGVYNVNGSEVELKLEYGNASHPMAAAFKNAPFSSDWALYTNGELEISSDDFCEYVDLWHSALKYVWANYKNQDLQNVPKLIIGGGDLQVANIVQHYTSPVSKVAVVDPLVRHIQMIGSACFPHAYTIDDFFTHEMLFDSFYEAYKEFNVKYGLICIDLSDDYLDIANSFYTTNSAEKIYNLLDDDGFVIAYMAQGSLTLGDQFEMVQEFQADIPTYFDTPTKVGIFKKVKNEATTPTDTGEVPE